MAYTIISQNNTTTTLSDENGNVITVPARVTLATSTDYTITKVNNNSVDLESGDGKTIRGVPACVVLAGGGSSDPHNLGFYADLTALQTAYPTGSDGDFAILGSTDTVWVWDSGTSAWKDTDTKGQVTSVNGQTGAVTLTIPDAVQYSVMPTAGADNEGDIVQFTGTTDANYTNGYFYKCVSDGQTPATYSWVQTNVQPAPSGLPDQTGQSGKFLTTDGTDASWSDKPLINQLSGNPTGSVGIKAYVYNNNCVAINSDTVLGANGVTLVGKSTFANNSNHYAVGIGYGARTNAPNAILINASGTNQSNSDANTFKIANVNGNFEIMSADGTVPHGRLTNAVVSNAVTIAAADWNGGTTCTKTISGLTATSVVWVAPDSASQSDYLDAGVYASAQTTDTITFTATTTPTSALTVNVIYC